MTTASPALHKTWLRKARAFLGLPLFEQAWFLPAWLLLGCARAVILVVPFRRLAPRLGRLVGPEAWVPLLPPGRDRRAAQIGRVVRRAARYTPWTSNCFPQAIVARLVMGIHGLPYALCLGVSRTPGGMELEAHAWIVAGRITLTGGDSFGRFAVVGCFVAPALLRRQPRAPAQS